MFLQLHLLRTCIRDIHVRRTVAIHRSAMTTNGCAYSMLHFGNKSLETEASQTRHCVGMKMVTAINYYRASSQRVL